MRTCRPTALLSFIGVVLIWPHVLTKSVSHSLQTPKSPSLTAGQEEEHPFMTKHSIANCESKFDNYCMNNGKCILLVELKEHHCKCERGFYGNRCGTPEFVLQPLDEAQVVVILFCVTLMMIGLGGTLYIFYKWYKRSKFQKQPKRKGVQMV
ncbi:proepiregulin-like [Cyprinodon tularosa]|uniref:Epiregulin n=1 Tax=Cyprinodon variegatus TaxID=28743 RepID=A0A3Q2FU89_CYPVA|nr:PREDICTED: proepiregulin [Cyprinodon variegatus]XP_038133250.1 proepiregulin-like [Cyprinodon tularosa]